MFSAGHLALAAAAVLAGLAWVERQEWWGTTPSGAADPRALQAFGVALALLGLGWAAARRAVAGGDRLRHLWMQDPFAADRIVIGLTVLGQLLLLAAAVGPAVVAELAPAGQGVGVPPADLGRAFGPGGWLLLELLAAGLVAALWTADDDEPNGDALLLGGALLGVCVPVAWAGTFAGQFAAASALRWGLAAAVLGGSALVWVRRPLLGWAARVGFRCPVTPLATAGGYTLAAAAAAALVLLTLALVQLGLTGQRPSGPADGTIFARMGYTASFLGPLVLLTGASTGTALRERAAGYMFAAGAAFVGTLAAGYALVVVTGGGTIDAAEQVRLGMLAAGGAAAWALAWLAAGRRVPGGPLLDVQAGFGLAGIGLLAAGPATRLLAFPPGPLSPAVVDLGRAGWLVLALAGWAGTGTAARRGPGWRSHVVGYCAVAAGVLAACAAQPWDEPGRGVSFHTLAAVWAVAGLALTASSGGAWVAVLAGGLGCLAVVGLPPGPRPGLWPVPLYLAGYAVATAGAALARRRQADGWGGVVLAAGLVAAPAVVFGAVATVNEAAAWERLAGALAVLLLAPAAGLLAAAVPAAWADRLRPAAGLAAAAGPALVGWALPAPDAPAVWLQQNGGAFTALVAAAVVCLEVVPRVVSGSGWAAAGRRVGTGVWMASLAAFGVVLLQQVPAFDPVTKKTPLTLPAVLGVLAAVAALIGLSVRAAVRPGADPFGLTEAKRTRYVYLAELLLVLFFVHVRFNLPELFLGQAVKYWTFLVMALAFAGAGLAELFERRGVRVLAGLLRRTGVLLPLIPLVAFWAKPPAELMAFADGSAPGLRPLLGYLEKLPQNFDAYAGLWLLAGLLYGLVALSRGSFGWALLGALAANAGLWALLTHGGVSAAVHPQVWAIPLALIVLVSEHVNRRTLRPDVSAGLRYGGIGMLYLSSVVTYLRCTAGNANHSANDHT